MFVEGLCVSSGALIVDSQRQALTQISAFPRNEGLGLLPRQCRALSRKLVEIARS
jgi:hypothetical protein